MKTQYRKGRRHAAWQFCFIAALSVFAASSLFSASALAGSVYMWKDSAGNVHFSDQPRDQAAQEVTMTHNNALRDAGATAQAATQATPQTAPSSSNAATQQSSNDARFDADMGSCDWLNRQLAKANADMNSRDEMTARSSRKFAADYKQALRDKRCPN